jgi:uncharacterized protein YigE (DUF2233 family)
VFAMNGGMYKPDNSPQGLYIENREVAASLDTTTGNGNFYLKPNGIFYITLSQTSLGIEFLIIGKLKDVPDSPFD